MASQFAAPDLSKPDILGEATMIKYPTQTKLHRHGSSLIEMMLLLSLTGGLMLFTVRVFNMATQVHEAGIQTATHLRLTNSLEDRLRGDIARSRTADATTPNLLRLVMPDSREVQYHLVKPNLVERKTLGGDSGSGAAVTNQRWQFKIPFVMQVEQKSAKDREIVRFKLLRAPTEKPWGLLREIEVSEVTHGP